MKPAGPPPPPISGVIETALYVDDLPRAIAFYQELFGFPVLTFVFILTQMPLIMRHSLEERTQDK